MSFRETALRLLAELRPVLPGFAAAAAATAAAFLILLGACASSWVCDRGFRLAGLFFGLGRKGVVRLACAWLKLVFMIVFVVGFQKLVMLNYFMLLLPGLLLALGGAGISGKLAGLMWLFLQTAGLLSVNLICGYIRDVSGGAGSALLYAAMGAFLILFSVYLFLGELADVSAGRRVSAPLVWKTEDREEAGSGHDR